MNKIIEINPALFTAGGVSKTKTIKNKSIKHKPIINPSVLKNKFLKRIKQHKTNEIKDAYKNKNVQPGTNTDLFTDEFSQSIEYLQKLSREKHKNADNQYKKDCLEKKTVKNYNSIYNTFPNVNQTNINIELPTELKEERFVMPNDTIVNPIITNNTPQVNSNIPIHIKPTINKAPLQIYNDTQRDILKVSNKPALPNHADIPYGILKGGNKPTYRAWNKTQKNNISSGVLTSNTIIDNKELSMREDKLNKLKTKIQERRANVSSNNNINEPTDRWMTSNFITNRKNVGIANPPIPPNNTQQLKLSKKIITKRYTLGKSKIKRQIGVLIKNRETRKKVICAHKELKQQPICDIKTYLNEHNLIKIGSKAPTDVMRKLYETAKLSGDIYNLNNDTLLHNLKKSDDNH